MNEIFLIDTNVLITPYQQYYRFSIAPTFWDKINEHSNTNSIKTIQHVHDEICWKKKEQEKDDLQKWFEAKLGRNYSS